MNHRVLAILLLGAVTSSFVGAQALSFAPANARPAGCHEHRSPLPSPEPVSHKCCQSGHYAAILQEPAKLRHSLACISLVADRPESLIAPYSIQSLSDPIFSSSPPLNTPLRI